MRKTYEVIVTRDTTESTVIRVEANNAKEAAAEALSESYNGRYIWEQDDTPNTSSDHYTTNVEQANSDLLARCLARPGKHYGAGYGFALAYLDDKMNPAHLRDAACHMVGKAYGLHGDAAARKSPDLAAFVLAYSEAERFEDFAIEAAQLLLEWGMRGDPDAAAALRLCGHPGY